MTRKERRMLKRVGYTLLLTVTVLVGAAIAQPLSQQVLQLLDRANTWTALNTFTDLTITGTCTGCGGAGGGTVTSVAMTVAPAAVFDIAGTPIVGSGTLALTMDTQADNLVFAGPNGGGPTIPTFRALVDADVPDILTLTGSSLLWSQLDFTVSSLGDITTASAADLTSGSLALARFTDGGTAGVPLVAGGGGGDPNYAALNLGTAAAITGTLASAQFPALTGDITTTAASLVTALSATGVAAATYGTSTTIPQIAVDAKGRITSASNVALGVNALLDAVQHSDTAADAATRGSIIIGSATNLWDELVVASGLLSGDGTDIVYTTSGSLITTGIDADAITVDEVILARGGTNASLTAANGGIFYSTATAGAITAAGTSGQFLISNGAAAPTWDTSIASINLTTDIQLDGVLVIGATAPTISAGFGTTPSVSAGASSIAFRIDVGTGGTATSGTIGLPAATTGWNCYTENITGQAANDADIRTVQTSSSTTTAVIESQTVSTGAAVAWTASDILAVSCFAY
jgi:hypothetical protein